MIIFIRSNLASLGCRWISHYSRREVQAVMGSFTSAPKIPNEDCQDNDVEPNGANPSALLSLCQRELYNLPPPLHRSFARTRDWPADPSKSRIRVMQWNVLSQALGQENDNFVACPDGALDWKTRRYRMLEEMLLYNPDILCLQEVDHYNFLKKMLGSVGYYGTFFPKPDSPCIYLHGNNGPDGCAIFYKRHRFDLLKVETRVMEVWHVQSNQVAILVIMRSRETGEEFCVVTTHLKARQGALLSTLRNEQGKDLLEFVGSHYGGRPIIICGDFNAEPTESVYSTMLSHPELGLVSGYTRANNKGEEPPYTTWKIREDGEVCHTIDYIFYSRRHLSVNSLLNFPTGQEIGEGRIPSLQYSSDHFSLVADFQLKPTASNSL